MSGLLIRDAAPADLPALVARLVETALLQRYGASAERLERDLRAELAAGQVLVAVVDGRPVGLAWFSPAGTFALAGYLRLIVLAPGEEGRGVGGALLDEVERRCALHSRSLFLLVSDWNQEARRFYVQRGYQEVGRVPKLVRDDTDEIIYWKRLASPAAK